MFKYIILKKAILERSSKIQDKGDINISGTLIMKIKKDLFFPKLDDSEGPFMSISDLKKQSIYYADLKKNNPTLAQKIIKEEYINEIKGLGFVKKGQEFKKDEIKAIIHAYMGTFTMNSVNGVHLYNPQKIKLIEIYNVDSKGVFEATFEIYNPYSDTWVNKKQSSTFFPKEWGFDELVIEVMYAFENLKKIDGKDYKFQGFSESGILIEFIIIEGKIKTFYPIIQLIS